ncbi:MAG TPA: hypothetical protein VK556_05035, partial [Candidatus Udaeobacter sp.]|nr:hypothetical protein [Candidatus Udaeobacter sp.]
LLGQSSISRRRQRKILSGLAFFFQTCVRTAWARVDSGTMNDTPKEVIDATIVVTMAKAGQSDLVCQD